jgi:hypothetical protein
MKTEPYHRHPDRRHSDDYRKEEMFQLRKAIRATENRLVLGMPDIGMGNLLRFLVTRTDWGERKVIFAYLDCDVLDDCKNEQMFFEEIARQFHEQGLGSKLEEDAIGHWRLLRLLAEDPRGREENSLVVVVYKADRMLEDAGEDFYRKLKSLTDHKSLCYIFAASPHLKDRVVSQGSLFAGRYVLVGRFNERDFAQAVEEEARRLGREFTSQEQKALAHLTGRHPGLLRAVTSAVDLEELDLSDRVTTLERLLAQDNVISRCNSLWQALNFTQQAALIAIANGLEDSVDTETIEWLKEYDFLEKDEGKYQLFSPVLERFVAAQASFSEKIAIRAGKVFRGVKQITLRPLEQKLLVCLMAEPGRVYTYDEIAWSVWGTTEVTNDMINGVASQLRSRLGKGYIKTHHRRGYEFIDEG